MLQKLASFFFLTLTLTAFSQSKIAGTSYSHFELKLKDDTVDFVIADTNLSVRKPLLLFCQGSLPVPLFLDFGSEGIYPVTLNNFNREKLNQDFHVAVISMPKTPVVVGMDHLNNRFHYVTDTADPYSYSKDYLQADYMENYVERANKVLNFLKKQKWIDADQIVVAGHSQGARVAVGIAASNKNVTHLGLFGYNPNGRIDQSIRQARKSAEFGEISWEMADSLQQEEIDFYELIQNPDSLEAHPEWISWKSFSESTIDDLVALKIPVYVAYGSQDIIADLCDVLPLYFIKAGKKNYLVKRYPNLDHNFFPLDENGRPNYDAGMWEQVMSEFIYWVNHSSASN